ncbi:MAG: hypothetical protein LBB27_01035 [Tannerellaceae bacterium]|jgi:hypothetical protein|nr:hypothetical protein [Tannerellaceae bacterium]
MNAYSKLATVLLLAVSVTTYEAYGKTWHVSTTGRDFSAYNNGESFDKAVNLTAACINGAEGDTFLLYDEAYDLIESISITYHVTFIRGYSANIDHYKITFANTSTLGFDFCPVDPNGNETLTNTYFLSGTPKQFPLSFGYNDVYFCVVARHNTQARYLTPAIIANGIAVEPMSAAEMGRFGWKSDSLKAGYFSPERYYYYHVAGDHNFNISLTDPLLLTTIAMPPKPETEQAPFLQPVEPRYAEKFAIDANTLRNEYLTFYVQHNPPYEDYRFKMALYDRFLTESDVPPINSENGKIHRLTLSLDNFLKAGENLFPAPFLREMTPVFYIDLSAFVYPALPEGYYYVPDTVAPFISYRETANDDTISIRCDLAEEPFYHIGAPTVEIELTPVLEDGTDTKLADILPATDKTYSYRLHHDADARIRITPPSYYTINVTNPKQLPGLSFPLTTGEYLYSRDSVFSFNIVIDSDHAGAVVPVPTLVDTATAETFPLFPTKSVKIEEDFTHIYTFAFQLGDATGNPYLELDIDAEYHDLTFPAPSELAKIGLQYVKNYTAPSSSESNATFYYSTRNTDETAISLGHDTLAILGTVGTAYVVEILQGGTILPVTPERTRTVKNGIEYYYALHFSGKGNFLSIREANQTVIVLPTPPAGISYQAGTYNVRPGDIFSFTLTTLQPYHDARPVVKFLGNELAYEQTGDSAYLFTTTIPATIPTKLEFTVAECLAEAEAGSNPASLITLDYTKVDTEIESAVSSGVTADPKVAYLRRAPLHPVTGSVSFTLTDFAFKRLIPLVFAADTDTLHCTDHTVTSEGARYTYTYSLVPQHPVTSVPAAYPIKVTLPRVSQTFRSSYSGISFENTPDGFVDYEKPIYYPIGGTFSFTLRSPGLYADVPPVVKVNNNEQPFVKAIPPLYYYTLPTDEDAEITLSLDSRTVTLPKLPEGLSYFGLPGAGEHNIATNGYIYFTVTVNTTPSDVLGGVYFPQLTLGGIVIQPYEADETNNRYTYRLKADDHLNPQIVRLSRINTFTLPTLLDGISYADSDGITYANGTTPPVITASIIAKSFTLHIDADYHRIPLTVSFNGVALVPDNVVTDADGARTCYYTLYSTVSGVLTLDFNPIAVVFPASLPFGVAYLADNLGAGKHFFPVGGTCRLVLQTAAGNTVPPMVQLRRGGTGSGLDNIPSQFLSSGRYAYEFTVTRPTSAAAIPTLSPIVTFGNLAMLITTEPGITVVSDRKPGIHYFPLTGIRDTLILSVDPLYAGIVPTLTVNGFEQAPARVQPNLYTYYLASNSGSILAVEASLRYNIYVLEQVLDANYYLLLPSAGTYYRNAGAPFSFRVQDYLSLGIIPTVTVSTDIFADSQVLEVSAYEGNDYDYLHFHPDILYTTFTIRVTADIHTDISTALIPVSGTSSPDDALDPTALPTVTYQDGAFHFRNLAGRPVQLFTPAGRLVALITPPTNDHTAHFPLPSSLYFLVVPPTLSDAPFTTKLLIP